MLKTANSRSARVVEIKRSSEVSRHPLSVAGGGEQALVRMLDSLREEMDGLALRLAYEHGPASESSLRAEQVAHAIQRLEWALDREQTR